MTLFPNYFYVGGVEHFSTTGALHLRKKAELKYSVTNTVFCDQWIRDFPDVSNNCKQVKGN